MKNYLTLLFLFAFKVGLTQSPYENFSKQFKLIEFENLRVYTTSNRCDIENPNSVYFFKGNVIDSNFIKNLKDTTLVNSKWSEDRAIAKYEIDNNNTGFLIGTDLSPYTILLYVYNKKKDKFIWKQLLSEHMYGESGSINTESWIMDVNKDGIYDRIEYTVHESISEEGIDLTRTAIVSIWENNKFTSVEIKDPTIVDHLMNGSYSANTSPNVMNMYVFDYINKQHKITIPDEYGNWGIVAGTDDSFEKALFEQHRINEILRYKFDYCKSKADYCLIYKKNEKFKSIIAHYYSKQDAEKDLEEIKQKVNTTSYIINMNDFCKDSKYTSVGLYSYEKCVSK